MDPRLQQAAESGSIDDFYALINENPYILNNIDVIPFGNTPLHVAAAFGNIPFALEMMNLKPSFATKLNRSGNSPLYLAVEEDHREFVIWLLRLDPGLARVKGREGITPFHLMVSRGNVNLVVECLITSPECIQDVSVNGHNALHLAVKSDRFEVLKVLTGWVQRMSERDAFSIESAILNTKDLAYNTPLHLSAYKNDHQAVRLLLECRLVKRNQVNSDGLTCLDILRIQGQNAGENLERIALLPLCKAAASLPKFKTTSDFLNSPFSFWSYCSTAIRRLRSDTSGEARGVFLIICTLIITSTYQTALQPPGGVNQSEGNLNDANAGSVVMKQAFFIALWVSNTIGFCCAIFYMFCLLPLRSLFTSWFLWIGVSLSVSYALAMAVISPHPLLFLSAAFALFIIFPLFLMMEVLIGLRQSHWKAAASHPRLSWFWKD